MDKKFRISFFPSDSSRVREVSFARRAAFLAAAILIPLSATGIWLTCAGPLHESREAAALRKRLVRENRALGEKVGKLDQDMRGLHRDLAALESREQAAMGMSGIGYEEEAKAEKSSSLFSFFRGMGTRSADVAASLDRARALSSRLDSALDILARQRALVEAIPTTYPVAREAIVTREFGYSPDPFTGHKALHAGVDFSLRAGAPVRASGGGTVAQTGKDLLWGSYVRVNHGRGVQTFYAHLQELLVRKGQAVARGEPIGLMGQTGVATGVHLHYELSVHSGRVDPMKYFLPELVLSPGMRKNPGAGS